ncbi:serine protease [Segetibacter sp. 3557_3]|uniref:S1C family serine protease n=1 Tax=Segetibacter sp. 3557_3 TaxID=2547429 RepID=UPI001058C0C1|nr:serine protease [Segetibacter sp. 3557_3]TDH29139.1 serine protease [Segetibacter sp. 3557_3]
MDEILLIDAVERYLNGEMTKEERLFFEELRKNNQEVDQMVVEHMLFVRQMNAFGENRAMRSTLQTVHNNLSESGEIRNENVNTDNQVIKLWRRYKKVVAIAATIASVTALVISGLVTYFTPVSNKNMIRDLNRKLQQINHTLNVQGNQISEIKKSKAPTDQMPANAGTSFLIDGKGYLATNAHVVSGSSTILVQNSKGQEFKARIAYLDEQKDLAILKIDDADFKPLTTLPYGIRRTNIDLGEQLFTLGFPKDEIVYNEGYLSAKTGYNGDTINCQIAVSANPGNSGGPVLNKNGEVIGILSTAQVQAEGVVFAIKSRNIYQALENLKKDTSYQKVKMPVSSSIKSLDRVQQIKQIEDCVYMVRGFTR